MKTIIQTNIAEEQTNRKRQIDQKSGMVFNVLLVSSVANRYSHNTFNDVKHECIFLDYLYIYM